MAEFYSPSANLRHKKDEAFSTDSVERSKDGNDPTRGYGYSLRNEYANAMLDPKNQGVSAGELLHRTARDILLRPMQDGSNLLTKTHEYTRAEQSQFFGGKATKALPGYEEWKADVQLNEKAALDREDWISGKELAMDTALGAVFGAATGALGSGVAGALAGAGIGAGAGLAFICGWFMRDH